MLSLVRKIKIIFKAILYALIIWIVLLYLNLYTEGFSLWAELNDMFFYDRFFKNPYGEVPYADSEKSALKNLIVIDSHDPKEEISRGDYARLIDTLCDAGAACVAFDIRFFVNKDWDRKGEELLTQTVRKRNETVILPLNFELNGTQNFQSPAEESYLKQNFSLPPAEADYFFNPLEAGSVELPYRELLRAARHVGHINFRRNRYELYPVVVEYKNAVYPSLPLTMARLFLQSKGKRLALADIPIRIQAQVFIKFIPEKKFEVHPMGAIGDMILDTPELVKGKMILIVNSSPEVPVVNEALNGKAYPLWALHASVLCQLVDNEYIGFSKLTEMAVSFVILFTTVIWILFIAERFSERWRKIHWLVIAGNLLLIILAFLAMQADYWFGVVFPVIIFTCALLVIRGDFLVSFPMYEDFSITVTESQRGQYPVSIAYSPVGEDDEKVWFDSFDQVDTFTETLKKFQNLSVSRQEMLEFGQLLYAAIFQLSIEARLLQSLSLVKRDGNHLRLRLRFDAPEISRLPWEYIYSEKLPIGFLALDSDISLTRYIPSIMLTEPKQFRAPLKILVAIASPRNLVELNVDTEKKNLKKSLRTLRLLRQVELSFCEHATLEKLAKEVAAGNYDVLHYIGHSYFDEDKREGFLLLEDQSGEAQQVEAEALGRNLQNSSVRMVILNSCEGAAAAVTTAFMGIAQKLVKVGVPVVIAMQHPIRDNIATQFAKTFYASFLAHFSVDVAIAEARRTIMNQVGLSRQDWGTPVLFMRADGAKIFGIK